MPSSDSTSETITLRGPQEKLGLGKLIEKSLDFDSFYCLKFILSSIYLMNAFVAYF